MSASKLTPKQEKFCQQVALGKCYSEAYAEAYNTKNVAPKSINELASRLAKKVEIRSRIEELKKKTEETINYTREDSFRKLRSFQEMALMRVNVNGDSIPDLNNAIKAEALILKLFGLETENKNLNIKGSDAFERFYNSLCESKDYNK